MAADADTLRVLQLAGLVGDPDPRVIQTYPVEEDARFMLRRVYTRDMILNCARPLEHSFVLRSIFRNYGELGKFPTPADVFEKLWGLIPDYLKDKITKWAKEGGQDGTIAREITSYVKTALKMLPIPIPDILLDTVANVVIPPLVQYIINQLKKGQKSSDPSRFPQHIGLGYSATPEIHEALGKLDAQILRSAGLSTSDLPRHLQKYAGHPDKVYPCLGQSDGLEVRVALKHFYQSDTINGCQPLSLAQAITAQVRSNPNCDPDPITFGEAVWATLSGDKQRSLKELARQDPPAVDRIAQALYQPVHDILPDNPYTVPSPILDSFTSMKVPEVTEWVLKTCG